MSVEDDITRLDGDVKALWKKVDSMNTDLTDIKLNAEKISVNVEHLVDRNVRELEFNQKVKLSGISSLLGILVAAIVGAIMFWLRNN